MRRLLARVGAEVRGRLGQGGGDRGPVAEQAGFASVSTRLKRRKSEIAPPMSARPSTMRSSLSMRSVQPCVARAQPRSESQPAVDVEHEAGLIARAVIGGGDVVPRAGPQQAGVGRRALRCRAVVSDQPEADLPRVMSTTQPRLRSRVFCWPAHRVVLFLLGQQETDADRKGLLGVEPWEPWRWSRRRPSSKRRGVREIGGDTRRPASSSGCALGSRAALAELRLFEGRRRACACLLHLSGVWPSRRARLPFPDGASAARGTSTIGGVSEMLPSITFCVVLRKKAPSL